MTIIVLIATSIVSATNRVFSLFQVLLFLLIIKS